MKAVLITQECFSCCWAVLTNSQGLFCFSPWPGDQQAEVTRCWEGTEPGELTAADVTCSNKSWGKGAVTVFAFPSVRSDEALFSWRWLNICLPKGSSEWIPYFTLLAWAAFALPTDEFYLNLCMFSLLHFQFSLSAHWGQGTKWPYRSQLPTSSNNPQQCVKESWGWRCLSSYHGITKWLKLEGTLKIISF